MRNVVAPSQSVRTSAALACAAAVLLLAGCIKQDVKIALRDAREAIEHINANYQKIAKPLQCSPALMSFRFRDADGGDRRFIGHPASIIFSGPRCLYFSIKSPLAGPVAQIGSNDELYWFWVDLPDTKKLWWGSWDALETGRARKLAVPPGQLLDALMLSAPAEALSEGLKPFLLVANGQHRLQYLRVDDDGWLHPARELTLDDQHKLPTRIVDYAVDGRIIMDAELGNYAIVDGTGPAGPLTPRRYVVVWPLDGSELRLDVDRAAYYEKDIPFCELDPSGWRGDQECLDASSPRRSPEQSKGVAAQ